MKKHIFALVLFCQIFHIAFSQTNSGFKYQAVLRNTNGQIIENKDVSLKISIIKDNDDGQQIYSEEHFVTTTLNGLINLTIGMGQSLDGDFNSIAWGITPHFLKIELNQNNSGYIEMGTVPLLSVPYALHAQTVANANDADADPTNEIQDLQLSSNILTLTNSINGTQIDLSVYENTDNQNLSLVGTELSISNGNTVNLNALQDGVDDADANPTNEIQQLSISNDTIYLSDGGLVKLPTATTGFSGSFNDLTHVPTNLDTDSTDDFSGDYADLNGAPNLSTVATSGSYTDLSNQPTLSGDATGNLGAVTVEKIQGQNVSVSSPSTGQVLKWTGSAWAPGSDATVAGGGVDGVVESISVIGSTTKTITLGMSTDAASANLTANFTDNVDDADADVTNEIQDLNLSGNMLTITNNGEATSIDLSAYLDNTDTQLTESEVDAMVSDNGYLTSFTEIDGSTTNEIQDLNLSGNILTITNNGEATSIDLSPYLDNTDTQLSEAKVDEMVSNNGYQLEENDDDVSSTNEIQHLSIKGTTLSLSQSSIPVKIPTPGWGDGDNTALFAVTNKQGDTVFAVYESGVRIFVEESIDKAARGGFAVATRSAAKGETHDILNVTNDSVRIYLEESSGKAARGGFAVATRSAAKGTIIGDILSVSDDSVRIYLEENNGKAARGGFAVATRSAAKNGVVNDVLNVSGDSVRVYLDENPQKAARGGFAVATRSAAKGGELNDVLNVSGDSVRVYIDNSSNKAARGGFAVATRSAAKNSDEEHFKISTNTEAEIIDNKSRILFYPNKDAFLAGTLQIESPDSVGKNSAAIGYKNIASGQYSQAFGFQAKARGNYSMAVGKNAVANGENSYAFGRGAEALESGAFAIGSGARYWNSNKSGWDTVNTIAYQDAISIGQGTRAYGLNSVALGYMTVAAGEQSFACGYETEANEYYSFTMGVRTKAENNGATAMGVETEAWGAWATAMGCATAANGFASVTMGDNTITSSSNSLAIGEYNIDNGSSLFMVGDGNSSTRHNAFTIYDDGNAELNNQFTINKNSAYNSPHILLHETGNDYARLTFDNTTADKFWTIAGYSNSTDEYSKMHFYYNDGATGDNFMTIAGDGNIGINTDSPESELHITQSGTTSGLHGIQLSTSFTNVWNIYNSGSYLSFKLNGTRVAYIEEDGDWYSTINGYNPAKKSKLKTSMLNKVIDLETLIYHSNKNNNLSTLGFDAREVQKSFPEIVRENENGDLGISYSKVSVVAIKAIQEQQEIIEKQQNEIEKLKSELSEIDKLKKELNEIKKLLKNIN